MSPHVYRAPTVLIKELGITEPQEINVEAIAQYCGATVVYEPLSGCAARIVGHGDRAIITVDSQTQRPRQRFSAAHELGHWMRDHGKVGFACTEANLTSDWTGTSAERGANEYAADLLLPQHIFAPLAAKQEITFATVEGLAHTFVTSITATAIRLVHHGSFPAMIVYSESGRRKWFIRGPDVPEKLWPREQPKRDTAAYDLMQGKESQHPLEIYADSWIDYGDAGRYGLIEDSIRIGKQSVLTLLWWKDERQLLDLAEEDED